MLKSSPSLTLSILRYLIFGKGEVQPWAGGDPHNGHDLDENGSQEARVGFNLQEIDEENEMNPTGGWLSAQGREDEEEEDPRLLPAVAIAASGHGKESAEESPLKHGL